jgi:hypothetical protein
MYIGGEGVCGQVPVEARRGFLELELQALVSSQTMVVHAFNTITHYAGAGGSLSSRPAWSTELVLRHQGLHKETLSKTNKKVNKPTSSCEQPGHGCWEPNSGPLQEL